MSMSDPDEDGSSEHHGTHGPHLAARCVGRIQ